MHNIDTVNHFLLVVAARQSSEPLQPIHWFGVGQFSQAGSDKGLLSLIVGSNYLLQHWHYPDVEVLEPFDDGTLHKWVDADKKFHYLNSTMQSWVCVIFIHV
jgi:hypothetical protein